MTLSDLCYEIIFKRQNLTEEQSDTLLVGRRHMTSSGHVLYHVGVSTQNASAGFAGHYQCIVERQYDRMFAIATVGVEGRQSPLPKVPQIELKFCHQNSYNRFESSTDEFSVMYESVLLLQYL